LLNPVQGESREVEVLTWLGPEKAVLMAVSADGCGFGSSEGLFDASVDEIGPADKDDRGLAVVGRALHDGMEF
jgi:hypothetical protein